MGDPSALTSLQRKLHTCQVLLWLKQTYQVQDDGKCDFVLSKELVYQAYLAMTAADEDLPPLTRPVLGKMVKRAFPSVPSIRRGPRGRVKQLYVGLVPQTLGRLGDQHQVDGRAKRLKKKMKMKEEEEYESTATAVGSPTLHRSDNEEEDECDNDGSEEDGFITTTTTTTTTTTDEEQTMRYSPETTNTTSSTDPTSSSSSFSSTRRSLESPTASPPLSSSSSSTTFFFASSYGPPLHDPTTGNAYQGPGEAWNGFTSRRGEFHGHQLPQPNAKVADMTGWARRAERLGRCRVMAARVQASSGEAPTTEPGGRISVVEWVELIIPADHKPS